MGGRGEPGFSFLESNCYISRQKLSMDFRFGTFSDSSDQVPPDPKAERIKHKARIFTKRFFRFLYKEELLLLLQYRRTGLVEIESNQLFILPNVYPSLKSHFFSKKAYSETSESQQQDQDDDYARVVTPFRTYGLTETQISTLMEKRPELLLYNPDRTLKPKLDFFNSIGLSAVDLVKILTLDLPVLKRSLENQIIPSYQFLKSVLHTDENVIAAIKRSTWVLKHDLHKYMAPNIAVLQGLGVSDSRISLFLRTQPRAFMKTPDRFRAIVEEIKGMGFDPLKSKFMCAIHGLTGFSKSTWERKSELYRKWGWSNNEILSAFKKTPACMAASEEKIERVMDFLVNKMGWDASDVVGCPAVFLHSLENWTTPRCLVVQALLSKGLIKKDFSLSTVIVSEEKRFLNKFVTKYCIEFPELLNLYKRKADSIEFST